MTDDIAGDDARYWAFISYSHRDAAFGRRLHRRLENYALPRRLVGRETAQGAVPRKLAPIFRDREELPAAHDLSTEVRAALKASRSLIVVCSPSAAASQWVGREIEAFRELHPGRPILAAVRDGEPKDCFPKALYGIGPGEVPIEPLAADFRRGRDGEQQGLLKLVAGIIGLGLDELIQRDAHRRNQRVTAVTAAALAGMIVMGVLTGYALNARSEADRQRAEAENLIGFMSNNLRQKLRGVGRLDIMHVVNLRALEYYDKQAKLTPELRGRRAIAVLNLADDDETRGDYVSARKRIHEAFAATQELVKAEPRNAELVFDHAQSEYYVGSLAYAQNRTVEAKSAFRAYKQLADRLVTLAPDNPSYRQEVGYADTNLCAIALDKPVDGQTALHYCSDALAQTKAAASRLPASAEITNDLIERHAWLADAYRANGNMTEAKQNRLIEESLLEAQITADPKNMDLRDTWLALQRALSILAILEGRKDEARSRLEHARSTVEDMIKVDPTNNEWAKMRDMIKADLQKLEVSSNSNGDGK